MSIATTLARYLKTNASVEQRRLVVGAGRTKSLQSVGATDVFPLQLSIWPTTLTWKLQGSRSSTEGDRLEDRFQFAISDIAYDIKPGDVLVGYPQAGDQLIVSSVNRYDDGSQPLPHLGGVLRRYTHQG